MCVFVCICSARQKDHKSFIPTKNGHMVYTIALVLMCWNYNPVKACPKIESLYNLNVYCAPIVTRLNLFANKCPPVRLIWTHNLST